VSWVALAWASQQRLHRASDKLILLAFADRHNDETGFAYPSIKWLEEFSSLNRKTVIQCIDRLETAGILIDSGRRVGATRQVKVYCLQVGEITVPKRGPLNSTDFSGKESQKRYSEPSKEPSIKNTRVSRRCPEDWEPNELDLSVGTKEGLDRQEVDRCLEMFRDYTFPASKSDWSATFRNWLRKAGDQKRRDGRFSGKAPPHKAPPRPDDKPSIQDPELRARYEALTGRKL
jgi:hypothetical protein